MIELKDLYRRDRDWKLHQCIKMETGHIKNCIKMLTRRLNKSYEELKGEDNILRDEIEITRRRQTAYERVIYFLEILNERGEKDIELYVSEEWLYYLKEIKIDYSYISI